MYGSRKSSTSGQLRRTLVVSHKALPAFQRMKKGVCVAKKASNMPPASSTVLCAFRVTAILSGAKIYETHNLPGPFRAYFLPAERGPCEEADANFSPQFSFSAKGKSTVAEYFERLEANLSPLHLRCFCPNIFMGRLPCVRPLHTCWVPYARGALIGCIRAQNCRLRLNTIRYFNALNSPR